MVRQSGADGHVPVGVLYWYQLLRPARVRRSAVESRAVAMRRSRKVIPLKKRTRKVIPLTLRRREAMDLVKFIDAHGGKLAPFRAYQQVRPASPSTST